MGKLLHVAIRTSDQAKSQRFYVEGLNLKFVGTRPSGVAMYLSDGLINLTLLPYDGPSRQEQAEGSEFVHLGFYVEDLAATYRRLIDLGGRVVLEDVKERRWHLGNVPNGSFKVLDPDGIVLDISERPDEWRVR